MPDELLNDLRLRIYGHQEKLWKSENFIELSPSTQPTSQNEDYSSYGNTVLKNRNLIFLILYFFIWKLEFVSNFKWMTVSPNSNIFRTAKVNIGFKSIFFLNYAINLLMASRLIDFSLAVLYWLFFKVFVVIGISQTVFFNFSAIERFRQNQK